MAVAVVNYLNITDSTGPWWGSAPIHVGTPMQPQPFIPANPQVIPADSDSTFTIKWDMLPIPGAPADPFEAIDPAVQVRARRNAKKLDVKLSFYGARRRRSDGRRGFRLQGEDIDVHIWLNVGDDWDVVLRAYAL